MTNSGESITNKIIVILGSGAIVGVSIANAVYFNRIQQSGGTGNVSVNNAHAMVILNIIIAIVAGIIFLWTLVRTITKHKSSPSPAVYHQTPAASPKMTTSNSHETAHLDQETLDNDMQIIQSQELFSN